MFSSHTIGREEPCFFDTEENCTKSGHPQGQKPNYKIPANCKFCIKVQPKALMLDPPQRPPEMHLASSIVLLYGDKFQEMI